jgi:predicted nucleotidyltransferase
VISGAAGWREPEQEQAHAVLRVIGEVLGRDAIGTYLHGSAVLGGLRPTSDIDLLCVTQRHTSERQRRELVDGLLKISGVRAHRGPARPVELTIVVQSDVQSWRYPPRQEFLYGEWLRDSYERGAVPEPELNPDLAVLIAMVLRGNTALAGPPPAQVLDWPPAEDLVRGAVEGLPQLIGDLDTDTRNVVLTLARIWTTVATGKILAKDEAADWVLNRLPPEHRGVLARARQAYLRGHDQERWGDPTPIRSFADYVINAIHASVVLDHSDPDGHRSHQP